MDDTIKKMLPKLEDHICGFNDGDCKCGCYLKALEDVYALVPAIIEKVYEELRGKIGEANNVDTDYTGADCGVTDCSIFWDGCHYTCQFCGKEYVMKDAVLSLLNTKK